MSLYKKIFILIILLSQGVIVMAQENSRFAHKIIVGYNFGGAVPAPLPREVRSITAYWPQFTPQLGYNISYDLNGKWSLTSGILLDIKGMGVRDKVKYMYTDVIMDGNNIKGYFTGRNETEIKISYVTVPIRVAYTLNDTWKLRAGAYISYKNSSEFSGTVWDGYIRETYDKDIANSSRLEIPNKGEATFDFGKDIRDWDMGVSLGFEHDFNKKFGLYTDITYSLTPIFPSSFSGIDMKMRNIYIVVGVSYAL